MMQQMVNRLAPAAVLCAAACACMSIVSAQENASVVNELRGRGVPVEDVVLKGDTVVARLDYPSGDASFSDHKNRIFEALAKGFPDSAVIRIEVYEDGDFVFPWVGATRAIAGYLEQAAEGLQDYPEVEVYLAEGVTRPSLQPATADAEADAVGTKTSSRDVVEIKNPKWWQGLRWPTVVAVILVFYGFLLLFVTVVIMARKKTGPVSPPVPMSHISQFDVLHPDGRRETVSFHPPRAGIGRHVSNALVIEDPHVSSRHAEIAASESWFVVRDLGSTNGTLVNEVQIEEKELCEGDVIRVGSTKIVPRA